MSDEQNGSVTVTVVTQEPNPSFLDSKIQLGDLLKKVSKETKKAIEVLVACLESKDERIRYQAATKLLEFQVQIAKEINADQMQRLIAEIKLNRQSAKKLIGIDPEDEENKKTRPIVDFSTIRQVE